MKKLLLAIFLLLSFAPRGEAQTVKLGVRGGANVGVYTFNDFILNGNIISPVSSGDTGYQVGLLMRFDIPGILFLQPELTYVNRIYSLGITPAYVNRPVDTWKMRAERLEFPVAIGLKIAALRLFGGPIFSLESRQSAIGKSAHDVNINFNDADIAAFAGIGLEMRHIFIEARCVKYLNKTQSVVTYESRSRTVDVTNDEYWQFSVGFFF